MNCQIIRYLLTPLIYIMCWTNGFSQTDDQKVYTTKEVVVSEDMPVRKLNVIHTDGQIIERKKFIGIIKTTKVKGAFASTYILKDTLLFKLTTGTREFLNREKTKCSNRVEIFEFNNEKLCYYSDSKTLENKGFSDSLLYEVSYYIDNGILSNIKIAGSYGEDPADYIKIVLLKAEEILQDKNRLLK